MPRRGSLIVFTAACTLAGACSKSEYAKRDTDAPAMAPAPAPASTPDPVGGAGKPTLTVDTSKAGRGKKPAVNATKTPP